MERFRPPFGPGRPVYHLFLDTSALVKLYVDEDGTDLVRFAFGDAYSKRASELAYPEARSAFARLHREGALDDEHLETVIGWLNKNWEADSYRSMVPDAEVCRLAGELAGKHSLRAYDAVHLATALRLRDSYRQGPAGDIVYFLTFDSALRRAVASEERLRLYEPTEGDDQEGDD